VVVVLVVRVTNKVELMLVCLVVLAAAAVYRELALRRGVVVHLVRVTVVVTDSALHSKAAVAAVQVPQVNTAAAVVMAAQELQALLLAHL
tara:strand:+ start:227 stop:496 length:270 start_codon:yes stop_codon:yes gene_type:complete